MFNFDAFVTTLTLKTYNHIIQLYKIFSYFISLFYNFSTFKVFIFFFLNFLVKN